MINIKKIFISAGESSGDIYGARLAAALKALSFNGVSLYGYGLTRMKKEGVRMVADSKKHSVMGVVEIISSLYSGYNDLKNCARFIKNERPDAVVLIDYAGFNLKLAQIAKNSATPVFYFIPPKLWAWGAFRMARLKKSVDKVYSIFGFENDFFRKHGVRSFFFGHPIFDVIKSSGFDYDGYLSDARKKPGGGKKDAVILMPGSRRSEISALLPLIIESAEKINQKYGRANDGFEFILPVAPSTDETAVKKLLKKARFDYKFVYSDFDKYESFSRARFALAASGTATLELALFGVPTVILYKVAALTELIGRFLLKTKYIGLPNILAGAAITPELVQREATTETIFYYASKLVNECNARVTTISALLRTADILGYECGASPTGRVAADLLKTIGGLK